MLALRAVPTDLPSRRRRITGRGPRVTLLTFALLALVAALPVTGQVPGIAARRLPVDFTENRGQWAEPIR